MELINEVSSLQRNKNFFNKLKSKILKANIQDSNLIRTVSADINVVDTTINNRFFFKIKYNIDDVLLYSSGDKLYLYAKLSSSIISNSFNVDSRQRDPGHDIPSVVIQKLKDCNNSYTTFRDEDIKILPIYKSYVSDLEKVVGSKSSIILKDSVHPKFKLRENAIPIIIYTESTNKVDFPDRELSRWETNVTSRKYRRIEDIDIVKRAGDLAGVGSISKAYTPYKRWTYVKIDVPFEIRSYDW